jgi:DNA oxidative demethylase
MAQPGLFSAEPPVPAGFRYRPSLVTEEEELALVEAIRGVALSAVEMRGQVAKRRTAHFGVTYGYGERPDEPGPAIPEFLFGVRARAAQWARIDPDAFAEGLITEYRPGAGIGWHRDAPMFGIIAGISLLAACRMDFRPYRSPAAVDPASGPRRRTHTMELEPRSGYLISGIARREYEHSIPPMKALRYSITFRTLRQRTQ